jgi:hypothetical protein
VDAETRWTQAVYDPLNAFFEGRGTEIDQQPDGEF